MGLERSQAVSDILHHGLHARRPCHNQTSLGSTQALLHGLWDWDALTLRTGQESKQKSSACTRLRSVRRPCRLRPRQQSTARQGLSVSRRWTSVAAHSTAPGTEHAESHDLQGT